jgi:hypothetical protein|tara:strand:- start:325 stop:831 length:507 start_codon:yes stop_codon:yes gene_type:complete
MKEIPNYPNYLACKKGFIYSKNYKRSKQMKTLKQIKNTHGYFQVRLYKNKKGILYSVHSLIMLTFKGERPEGLVINHLDADKSNNSYLNLEYVTQIENVRHAIEKGLHSPIGEKNHSAKLTRQEVIEIKTAFKQNYKGLQKQLASKFNVSRHAINKIISGKNWKHITI